MRLSRSQSPLPGPSFAWTAAEESLIAGVRAPTPAQQGPTDREVPYPDGSR